MSIKVSKVSMAFNKLPASGGSRGTCYPRGKYCIGNWIHMSWLTALTTSLQENENLRLQVFAWLLHL
jgi:hypothetical protein